MFSAYIQDEIGLTDSLDLVLGARLDKFDIDVNDVKNLMNDFDIIHLHGNNHCGLTSSGVPIALEITLMHKIYRPKEIVYEKNFPINGLDFPNNPLKNDINFSFK